MNMNVSISSRAGATRRDALPAQRRLAAARVTTTTTTTPRHRRRSTRTAVIVAGAAAEAGLPSLDGSSTWRLHFDLFSGREGGSQTEPDRTVAVTAKFAVDEGYEPPQGVVQIVSDESGVFADGGLNRWKLEEDPNEKKGGLWIWGLFEEPLYPYMLLSMDVNRLEVAEGGYHIPAGKLYAEVKHARGSKSGHVLSDGVLNFKVTKTYAADLVGLSKALVGEPTMCGRLRADCVEAGR
jgi:hypothetical protein